MNAINVSNGLNNNFSKLLFNLANDFEQRTLNKCHQRGHIQIRRSHMSLFSNLGFESVRLTELAGRAGITQQAMGKLVKEMERVGYVKRHTDESDKRAKIIELTDRGIQLVNDSTEIVNEVTAEYTAVMGEEGIEHFEQVLRNATLAISQLR